MKIYWIFAFVLLSIIAIYGAFGSGAVTLDFGGSIDFADTAWLLTATGLVFLMTPGLSFFYGGMVSPKNVISTMLQSFIAMGIISIVWVVFGFSLAFGDSLYGIVGNPATFFMFHGVTLEANAAMSPTIPFMLFAFFQLKFAIITPALITGSFAERVRFTSYLLFIILFSIFIYAPLAHMTWHPDGFLRNLGVLDFAGGTVVHLSAGLAALAGAFFLGPRKAYTNGGKHLPANIPFVLLGTGLLWFGWFGFNAGSALAANKTAVLAFGVTNTASASAALAWVFFDAIIGKKPSALGACIGAVVGLVAITPAAGYVTIGQSIFIGMFAAVVSNIFVSIKTKTNLDDTLDVFPCHGVGGIVGMIMTALFVSNSGLIYGKTETFISHIIGLLIVIVFAFGGSYLLYFLTNKIIPMRVTEEQEKIGLDLSQHNESAID